MTTTTQEFFIQTVQLECWHLIVLFLIVGIISILAYIICNAICNAIVPKGTPKILLTICIVYVACAFIYYEILGGILELPQRTIVDKIIFWGVVAVGVLTSWHVINKKGTKTK